jgi:sphingosine kinase
MGGHRFVVGFIQRALAGPHYECEISMRIVQSDKEAMKQDILQGVSHSHVAAEKQEGMPSLRFGTVNDPIPSGPDLQTIEESKASGWTTLNAPIASMYAGTVPYLADNLLQFPIASSDGNIVVSILPVVSTATLIGVSDSLNIRHEYLLAVSLVYGWVGERQALRTTADGVLQGRSGKQVAKVAWAPLTRTL